MDMLSTSTPPMTPVWIAKSWFFPRLPIFSSLDLTVSRQLKFNTLVRNINKAIHEVVKDVTENSNIRYKVGMANWDPWPREVVSGQFCNPSLAGRYPNLSQGNLQSFKLDAFVSPLRQRGPAHNENYKEILR